MLIKSVHVRNFRSIRGAEIECDPLTLLIGRNGAGKSSFLHALSTFYDLAAPITAEDFFNRQTSDPIEIRVTYGDLGPAEAKEFNTFVRDGTFTVTKRIALREERPDATYFAASRQVPHFADIRNLSGRAERTKAWRELVDAETLPDLSGTVRSADDVDRLMREYEAEHPATLKWVEQPVQFFGPPNVGGGKLDKYTKFVLIPAVRQAAEEAGGRRGAVHQILDTVVLRKLTSRSDVREFRRQFEKRARDLFGGAAERDLKEVAASLTESLAIFAPGAGLNLTWGEVSVPEMAPPSARVTLVEDRFEGDVERKGHGLQRALILTLLRQLAILPPADEVGEREGEVGEGDPSGELEREPPAAPRVPDLILAIEEPELFLHPSRCRYLSRLLMQLTEQTAEPGPRNQVLYTTHSPHFVDLARFDHIRRVSKAPGEGAVAATAVARFSREEAKTELARVSEADPETFTPESFAVRAHPVMTQVVGEGFFADAVVLVEGETEVGALWKLQELLGAGWAERGVALIGMRGKTTLDRPAVIFRGLGIPTYVLFDADRRHRETQDEATTARDNRRCLRLVDADESDPFPATQVHPTWGVLEDCIEATLNEELGEEELLRLIEQTASELGSARGLKALKNAEVAARVAELAYERGLRLPTLERVVEAASTLVN